MLRAMGSLRLVGFATLFAMALPALSSACASEDDNMNMVEYTASDRADASASGSGGSAPITEAPCAPEYCPGSTVGAPCCVTREGPCGIDLGMGCQVPAGPDQ
jgi:hypothetical protein